MSFFLAAAGPRKLNPNHVGRLTGIVRSALLVGPITFAGIVLLVIQPQHVPHFGPVTAVSAGALLLFGVMSVVIPTITTIASLMRLNRQQLPMESVVEEMAQIFLVRSILQAAPLEGAAFLALVAYLIEGHWSAWVVAGLALALQLVTFPSQRGFEEWVAFNHRQQPPHSSK